MSERPKWSTGKVKLFKNLNLKNSQNNPSQEENSKNFAPTKNKILYFAKVNDNKIT